MFNTVTRCMSVLAMILMLGPAGVALGQAENPVIRVEGNRIVLANDVGCKLEILRRDGKYGLGTFYVNNRALGEPIDRFLSEDNIGNDAVDTVQRIWAGTWEPGFRATSYEILENSPDRGVIKFSGQDANPRGSVTITLRRGSAGYRLDFEVTPAHSIKHPLYVSAPFFADKMEFVQFPFENPLIPPFRTRWTIQPTRSTVPLMFGSEKIDGRDYFVGIGYRFDQDYQRGSLEYDTGQAAPFKLRYISPHDSGWLGRSLPRGKSETYRLSMVISTAATQYDCITGYRLESGFDVSTPIRGSLDDSLAGMMAMYKNSSAYVSVPPFENKAYHLQINPATGKPPEKGYGAFILMDVQLAYQLYRYWESHREETWAKERAIQMAGFFVAVQNANGTGPEIWDPQAKRFRAITDPIDKAGYRYSASGQAVGAYSLYRLYLARKATENVTVQSWRDTALRAMDNLAGKVQPDGVLGRAYDEKGNYDAIAPPDAALIALDYFAAETHEAKYDAARARLEKWTYETFIRTNHWFGGSIDNGSWGLPSAPPLDVDALNTMTVATYCIYRHMRTGDAKYLDWAKNMISYNWLVGIPIQFPEFKHVTKALVREQDFYNTYDVPFRVGLYMDGLPYLSAVTGDRFFMDYYRLQIQTQIAYQNKAPLFQSFNIGLYWDASGANPSDLVGEPDVNYILGFCSLYLDSVTSPYAYRYVGGPDWGQGLDYDPSFTPHFDKQGPWVISSSSRLSGVTWVPGTKTLLAVLEGHAGDHGTLAVGWEPGRYSSKQVPVLIDGKAAAAGQCRQESQNGREVLYIGYAQERDTTPVEISFP